MKSLKMPLIVLNILRKLNKCFAGWNMFTIFAVFNDIEHEIIIEHDMDVIAQEIANQAIGVIHEKMNQLPIQETHTHVEPPFDTKVTILGFDFNCVVVNELTAALLKRKQQETAKSDRLPIIYIAKYVSPRLMDELCTQGINVLDCAGNCHIHYEKEGLVLFHIQNKGEKNERPNARQYPMFQEAGLKVILFLLLEKTNVALAYRKIQEATDVSLGTVKNILDELTNRGFILNTKEGRFLKDREELLEQWAENYNQVMRPKLLMGKMKFRSADDAEKWKELKLPEGMCWGGECAAHLMDPYLIPGAYTIYTEIPTARLMGTGKVQFDETGYMDIYKKFWKTEGVPAPVVYADLLNANNGRCTEAAQRLIDNGQI
jgi:hypothetical protein